MKKTLLLTTLLFLSGVYGSTLSAQNEPPKDLPNFLFPEFTKATIKLKQGNEYAATLNYNLIDEEMVFLQGDTYMVLDKPQEIDTITVGGRKFIPYEKSFYELVFQDSITLFVQYKSTLEPVGNPGAYGTTSQSYTTYYTRQVYGPVGSVTLSVPDNMKITSENSYWVSKNSELQKFSNKKQFFKLFKEKEKALDKYCSSQKVDFKKVEDVIQLINYCNSLYK